MGRTKFHPLYILAILYTVTVYLFPLLWYALSQGGEDSRYKILQLIPLFLPGLMGIVNLIAVLFTRSRTDREVFLHCAVIIKYCLVPFYLIGGTCIALAWLLTFTPVVIMVFVGPAVAVSFTIMGYISLLGSAPFAITYIVKSCKAGVHSMPVAIAGSILQFFFIGDTITMIVLSLKERKCVKAFIALAAVLVLAVICLIGGIIQLVAYSLIKK